MAERFYVTEQLSKHISRTPEGFLLCEAVPINRTGEMIYNEAEARLMPWLRRFEPDSSGRFRVIRDEDEVFRPETLASWTGKPFILLHPEDGRLLRPDNWAEHVRGNVQNVRRGEGDLADCTLADVLAATEDVIELILAGLREVSCGYDADYVQIAPGVLRQINIVGNHVALVDKGRAGARCAIQDSEEGNMTFRERLKRFLASKGAPASVAATLDAMSDEEERLLKEKDKGTKDEDTQYVTRKELEETLDSWWKKTKDAESEEETRRKEEEEKAKKKKEGEDGETEDWGPGCHTKDSAFQDIAVRAEIMVPGYTAPRFTADAKRVDLDRSKRDILKRAYATEQGKQAIERFTGENPSFDTLPRATLDVAFTGASELIGQANNTRFARRRMTAESAQQGSTIAAMNKRNTEFWSGRKTE